MHETYILGGLKIIKEPTNYGQSINVWETYPGEDG